MTKRIQVVINPASGQNRPILRTLSTVFDQAGIRWEVSITMQHGDACRLAREAAQSGVDVVAVYGGDGTIADAAAGLAGQGVPLAILPGGTANNMAHELGIPVNLAQAARLVVEGGAVQPIDLGRVGKRLFLVRLSIGLLADAVLGARAETKAQFGELAYIFAALQAMREPHAARYQVTVDGRTEEVEGVGAFIANSGSAALHGVLLAPHVDVSDGLLDVVVFQRADLPSVISYAVSAAAPDILPMLLPHWRGREIAISAEPPHTVAVDGEPLGQTPLTASVVPGALAVIVPATVRLGVSKRAQVERT